jgi:hypothetical protein
MWIFTAETQCEEDQFKCNSSGSCVSMNLICDGKKDCPDGSDEADEICGRTFEIILYSLNNEFQGTNEKTSF